MSTRYKIGDTEVTEEEFKAECAGNPGPVVVIENAEAFYRSLEQSTQKESLNAFDDAYARMHSLVTGNTPEAILARLAERLGCEPRQVFDRVVRMLEEAP